MRTCSRRTAQNNAAHFQRKEARAPEERGVGLESRPWRRRASRGKQKDTEMDMELVLYEFVEVLIRVALWRQPVPRHPQALDQAHPAARLPHLMLTRWCCPTRSATTRRSSGACRRQVPADRLTCTRTSSACSTCTRSRGSPRPAQAAVPAVAGPVQEGWGAGANVGGTQRRRARLHAQAGQRVGNWQIYQDSEITATTRATSSRCRSRRRRPSSPSSTRSRSTS